MNHRKHKQAQNLKKKVYTPEGYIKDPPDAVCPHCGQKQKPCSAEIEQQAAPEESREQYS